MFEHQWGQSLLIYPKLMHEVMVMFVSPCPLGVYTLSYSAWVSIANLLLLHRHIVL